MARHRLRIIVPAYPAFNIYSGIAKVMTALGPVCVATAVHDIPGWDAEVIDENNYRSRPAATQAAAGPRGAARASGRRTWWGSTAA